MGVYPIRIYDGGREEARWGAVKKRKVGNDEEERKSQRHAWTEIKN